MNHLAPVLLLCVSNMFMTYAWYGHLTHRSVSVSLWQTILVSWGIAFFEYALMIPANQMGHRVYTLFQLKTIQEVISLVFFSAFAVYVGGETLRWNHVVAGVFLVLAVILVFYDRTAG
jgi:uncharacterized protein (DUF486 family)